MTNQQIKENIQKIINYLEASDDLSVGICFSIMMALRDLSAEERIFIQKIIKSYRPGIFSRFFWNASCSKNWSSYWWSLDSSGKKQRIKFLNYVISKIQKNKSETNS